MDERIVHIIGAGSVGLAYGSVLTARGHKVSHTSLRGNALARIAVRTQTSEGTVSSTYAPRYFPAEEGPPVPDLSIFAVPVATFHRYVSEAGGRPPAGRNLLFCSLFDPGEYQRFASRCPGAPGLVFPIISCEYDEEDALRIATNWELDVLASADPAAMDVNNLLGDLGFAVNPVAPGRFRARYVQTAAAYIALGADRLGLAGGLAKEELVVGILAELSAMAGLAGGEEGAESMRASIAQFAALWTLAGQGGRSAGGQVIVDNIRYLMGPGRRKILAHLDEIGPPWEAYLSSLPASPPTGARDLISAVLATA